MSKELNSENFKITIHEKSELDWRNDLKIELQTITKDFEVNFSSIKSIQHFFDFYRSKNQTKSYLYFKEFQRLTTKELELYIVSQSCDSSIRFPVNSRRTADVIRAIRTIELESPEEYEGSFYRVERAINDSLNQKQSKAEALSKLKQLSEYLLKSHFEINLLKKDAEKI